ncbi:MAG: helix-hairpin-helix domain-containing protein [Candidatus Aminicenantales bacterium]|jgi:comEA protein
MKRFLWQSAALAALISLLLVPLAEAVAGQQSAAGKAKVNINSAGLNELQALPRIGPKIAQRILDFRKEHGPFKRVEELMKVKGIGEKMFGSLKDLITVGTDVQAK